MPGDEADGCEPDVSPFEIATQSWETFDLVYRQTHDAQVAGGTRQGGAPRPGARAQEHDRPELEDSVPGDGGSHQIRRRKSTS